MKTGFTPLLFLVEKKPDDGVYVLDKESMPSTPGPLEPFLTVLILPAWQDTMAYTDTLFPPRQIYVLWSTAICKTSVPAYIASVGFTCPNLGTWKLDI